VGYYEAAIEYGATPLFEICGPDNRIVLQYDENFLAPLGFMNIEHGFFTCEMPNEVRTMRDLLMDLSRTNAEGWVVWKTAYEAVKIKQADYIELHRIVSNLSKKEVWRQLRAGSYNHFKTKLPDEWWSWAENIADVLRDQFSAIHRKALAGLAFVPSGDRKTQALYIVKNIPADYAGLVFAMLDGKDTSDTIWRMIEPRGDES
jgi:RNA ligase